LDLDLLADPRLDLGFNHRAACRDVDHRHFMLAAAEIDERTVQNVAMPVLASFVRQPRFLALHRDCRQTAEARLCLFRLLGGNRGVRAHALT
jgi:hypothetical protein